MKFKGAGVCFFLIPFTILAAGNIQASGYISQDSLPGLELGFDFTFRPGMDWNSRKSDGSYRDDRFRLRYRFRANVKAILGDGFSLGSRVRTGTTDDQTGSPVTIGLDGSEFEAISLVMDRLYLAYESKGFWAWIGKNAFGPWRQNVFAWDGGLNPDGLAAGYTFISTGKWDMEAVGSYFITSMEGPKLADDHYMTGFSLKAERKIKSAIATFQSAYYYFNELPNIPDDQGTYVLSYRLLQLHSNILLDKGKGIRLGIDLQFNLEDYESHTAIPLQLRDETNGIALTVKYGSLSQKGDYAFGIYAARMEKFSMVDYFAENEFARWSYSSAGSDASRLSNYRGIQLRAGYQISNAVSITGKVNFVKQIEETGPFLETGSRARMDLYAKF